MHQTQRRLSRIPPGDPRLLEGARLFNAGAFFESHEVWETLWHEVGGRERELLQGLIQIAAAYHHLARKNYAGALYLYTKGRARLARWGPRRAGIALDALLAKVDGDIEQVRRGQRLSAPPVIAVRPAVSAERRSGKREHP